MESAYKSDDSNLSGMTDEELVRLAKDCGCEPAAVELILRHRAWVNAVIAHRAKKMNMRLAPADVQDAYQDAVFAITRAIAHYDTLQLGRSHHCSFRTFLYRVVTDHFGDFIKHLWRVERHYDHSAHAADMLTAQAYNLPGATKHCTPPDLDTDDPAMAAELQEVLASLHQAVNKLKETERWLLEKVLCGTPFHVIAREQGVSCYAARHQWQEILAQLRSAFPEWVG